MDWFKAYANLAREPLCYRPAEIGAMTDRQILETVTRPKDGDADAGVSPDNDIAGLTLEQQEAAIRSILTQVPSA